MTDDPRASASSKATGRSRVNSLDGLRGVAALAVVLYHFGYRSTQIYPNIGDPIVAVVVGQYGVQLFFVISGFVIVMTIQRMTVRSFLVSRAIRLYPIYWVCLFVTFAIVAIAGLPGREVPLWVAIINLTMVQQYMGIPSVDGAYWTLAAELAFYVQVGALFFAKLLRGARLIPTLYVWLASSALVHALSRMHFSQTADAMMSALNLGFTWAPLFVSGIAAYHLWSGSRSIALIFVPVATVVYMAVTKGFVVAGATVCVLALFGLALWGPKVNWFNTPLNFLGAISYPLYLIHQNIGYVLILFLLSLGLNHLAAAAVTLVVMLALAAVLTYFVDVPLRAALRELCEGHLKQRELVAVPVHPSTGTP